MAFTNPYLQGVYDGLAKRNPEQKVFLQAAEEVLESLEPVSGRFNMIETDKFMIVDDCYNANPMSMKASLDVLQDGLGRKVAILGDMG